MTSSETVLWALAGGVLPALVWLSFWLREDRKRPEPKGRIIETFVVGMFAVVLVLPFQKLVANVFPGLGFMPFFLWAVIEESFKFGAAYFAALRTKDDDEPIDHLIYMITAALGFVALENALFIWNPLLEQNVTSAISTGGLRFIGASLLHVVASGVLGTGLALAFYKSKREKVAYAFLGLAAAIAIHTAFNLFILQNNGSLTMNTFAAVWIGAAIILLFFEKVKSIAPPSGRDIIRA